MGWGSGLRIWKTLFLKINRLKRSDAIFPYFIVWVTFGRKMGVMTTEAHKGLRPLNPTKNLTYWLELLDRLLSRNHIFRIIRSEPL